ncbi:MAG TPA: hypothetical protein VMD59_02855 [Acidimicrobiales bacterium]|nr:hypothetical protein [Acidimicrobiales bacterium]
MPGAGDEMRGLAKVVWYWAKSGTRQWRIASLGDRMPFVPEALRYRYLVLERPNYAYGVQRAVDAARRQGHCGVTVIEFGVAGGNGLLALERHARYFSARTGVAVDVVGFDSGSGLPAPTDYRDQPFRWAEGYYPMDEEALRARLDGAELILGDISSTVGSWLSEHESRLHGAPIGFIAFDLDFWSSTVAAFDLFRRQSLLHLLPRVLCYFDDIVYSIAAIGELRAISELNAEMEGRMSIGRVEGLRAGIPLDPPWADQIFEAHLFEHPHYLRTVESSPTDLPLRA